MTQQIPQQHVLSLHQGLAVARRLARTDPAAFASYVLRDEETKLPIVTHPIQREWHRLFSEHKNLILWGHPESGRSSQMSIARVLFELGLNPNLRVLIVTATLELAQKLCGNIARYIEGKYGPQLHRVFPGLRPALGEAWSATRLVVRRTTTARDPSVWCCGVESAGVTGARVDLLILDDIVTQDNTYTAHQRERVFDWVMGTLVNRMSKSGRVLGLGNTWHPDDAYHRMAARGWVSRRYPVRYPSGQLAWPERWSAERVALKESQLLPGTFSRVYLCEPRSDEDARFRKEWIHQCCVRGDNGTANSHKLRTHLNQLPPGCKTFTGVDLSTGKAHGDLTCIFTIMVYPNGDREVLNIQSGRWQAPEITSRIEREHEAFSSIVTVEASGQQELLIQQLRASTDVPVKSYFTSAETFNDPHHGIETMAVEMANSKWIIPSKNQGQTLSPEVAAWVKELLYYDPASHPGDRLMGSHFAVEGSRIRKPKGYVGRADTLRR